ncbi:MAG TPA: pitrilysin family protein [Candidatus Saccharimonas sp.]|nr:pitrilysin family protein [Candidatus Saccharimonas sp.]
MKISETTLANGLKIITAEMAEARSVTANIVVGTGSRYEEFKTNGGVSHFLEHLLFKGSAKYPTAEVIAEAIDAVGGFNNAYTSEDLTLYYIKVPGQHRELALDILADMVAHPVLDAAEVDRERGVIIEEMNVWRDDPARFIGTMIPELIFPDNPLGKDIIGTEEVIRQIAVGDIRAYMQQHYTPGNTVVAVAGQVKHEEVVRQMQAALGDLKKGELVKVPEVGETLSERLSVAQAKPTAQAHFVIGARAYGYDHPDDPAAKLLAAILGRGMSSRLFINVRERQGLAYTVYSEINNYTDTGIFHAYAGVTLEKVPEAIRSVLDELERIREEAVGEAELRKAKQQLRAGLEMGLESNGAVADRIGTQLLLLGRAKTVEEMLAELEAVTSADVQRVAQAMLAPERLRLAIIAPEPGPAAAEFEKLVTKKQETV